MTTKETDTKELFFKREKETKRTVRFEEQTQGEPPTVGKLYVQKSWAEGKEDIRVILTDDLTSNFASSGK